MKEFVGASSSARSFPVPATMRPEPAPDPRRQMMLSGPIAATLLRFAAPTMVLVTVQALVSVMETYFVGFLGTDALAGDTRVLQVIYRVERDDLPLFVGHQLDVFIDAAPEHGGDR